MKLRICIAIFFALALFITSCKRDDKFMFALEGTVKNARSGAGLSSASLELSQQEIASGTFNDNFVHAGHTLSDGSGFYRLDFARESVVEYKLEVEKTNYISREFSFVPVDFSIGNATTQNIALYPEAFIVVHLHNDAPTFENDVMKFRFDQVNFDCQCCMGGWVQQNGEAVDSSFSCRLYGETWLKYVREITSGLSDTLMEDSIWCPSFITTQLDISY